MKQSAYLIARLALGASIFLHGLVRMPKLTAFAQSTAESFQQSMLPEALVLPFAYLIVFAEFGIGLLLLLGLFTRQAAFACGLLMVLLITGACMTEYWAALPAQLLHTGLVLVVLQFVESNTWAVDRVLKK